MNERKEILYSYLDQVFEPKSSLSPDSLVDKWRVIPYETENWSGNLLSTSSECDPEDISFAPQLTGWYKIYVGLLFPGVISIKLTSDPTFFNFATSLTVNNPKYNNGRGVFLEETLWRCGDLTGESIILSNRKIHEEHQSRITHLRFVPMTEEEVAEYQKEEARTDTKRIYASDDMHNRFYCDNLESLEDWSNVVLRYRHSDVEWISMEEIRLFASGKIPVDDVNKFAFPRKGDKHCQAQISKFDFDEVLRYLVNLGHDNGYKMTVALRMGAWGIGFPYDQFYFDNDFAKSHPEYRCVDRNGDPMSNLSYAFPEVQQYIIDLLVNAAASGSDAVTLIANRGVPYVLFEEPIAKRFFEKYGEYPYELPLDDPRLNSIHCEIMTEFARRLRRALDDRYGKGKVALHLRSFYSIYDTKYVGLDVEQWAKEGLINAVISYPQRNYERLAGDIWQEGKDYRIDLDKYTDYVIHNGRNVYTHYSYIEDFQPGFTNYRGEICGPATQKERISQWMALEEKYGVQIYIDMMGRHHNNDRYKQLVQELYDNGAERIGMWDCNDRATFIAMWSIGGRCGHKEELADMDAHEFYKVYWIRRLAGFDVSRYDPFWGG